MRDSSLILLCFIGGIVLAYLDLVPDMLLENDPTLPALWLLMAFVGFSLGMDRKMVEIIRHLHPSILLLPVATTIGTFGGCVIAAAFLSLSLSDCLAVGSGFAYYSLSSVFITQYKGPDLGTIALIANILRELFTLLLTPVIVPLFGPMAAISCGGASSMDTTLPIIMKCAGKEWMLPSIIHAACFDFSIPFWVMLFCSI